MPQQLSHMWQRDHSYPRCTVGAGCRLDVRSTASRALEQVGCSFKENTDPSGGAPGSRHPGPLLIPGHPRWRCCSEAQLPRHPASTPAVPSAATEPELPLSALPRVARLSLGQSALCHWQISITLKSFIHSLLVCHCTSRMRCVVIDL